MHKAEGEVSTLCKKAGFKPETVRSIAGDVQLSKLQANPRSGSAFLTSPIR